MLWIGRQLELVRSTVDLLEHREAGVEPSRQVGLHGRALHAGEPLRLRRHVAGRAGAPLGGVRNLSLAAAFAGGDGAERGPTRFLHKLQQVGVLGAQLVAHRHVRLLLVVRAAVAGGLVKVLHGGPAAHPGVVLPTDGRLRQVDVAKGHVGVVFKQSGHRVPTRRLLPSSTSALAGNPANKESLVAVDGRLHGGVEVVGGQLGHLRARAEGGRRLVRTQT
mmetsp:Transcript_43629/g.109428  ORF Transcript_43629/g.109428 Transcript_43629/m.109428 type:complete len:220 (+) Transcript_43629:74-733(+)